MMTSAPSPRSNVTLTKVAAEKLFLGFLVGNSTPTQALSHTRPPGTATSIWASSPQRRPVSTRIEMICGIRASTMRPRRELDRQSPAVRRQAATSAGLKFSATSNALRST
jgi:hypothetical protein